MARKSKIVNRAVSRKRPTRVCKKGKYAKCFEELPYSWCPVPEMLPDNPVDVPEPCRSCVEFLTSRFYIEARGTKKKRRAR